MTFSINDAQFFSKKFKNNSDKTNKKYAITTSFIKTAGGGICDILLTFVAALIFFTGLINLTVGTKFHDVRDERRKIINDYNRR